MKGYAMCALGFKWQPMETAPKEDKNTRYKLPYKPAPRVLLRFGDEGVAIAYWDWYYAEGGAGYTDGFAWVEAFSGDPLNDHFSIEPDGWMELPK